MYETTEEQKVRVFEIAAVMAQTGISPSFIMKAIDFACQYEGVYELMVIWLTETDSVQKDYTITSIQEIIDDQTKKLSYLLNSLI